MKGPAKSRAGDIQVPADFEVANPELHLANLDSGKARLNVELHAQLGKGYVPAGSVEGMPIGVIPVDAIFSPVRKVNYRVEKTRVGQSTNYDRLILEVWTDGTIGAVDAVGQSADILMDQFSLFSAMGRPDVPSSRTAWAAVGARHRRRSLMPPDRYNTPIEDLNLSVRAYNCLKRSGLMTVGQVLEKSEDELLALRNFGRKSYDELRDRLIELGYVDGDAEGLVPIPDAPKGAPAAGRPTGRRPAPRTSAVIIDEDDEEENLSALGKALKEALLKEGTPMTSLAPTTRTNPCDTVLPAATSAAKPATARALSQPGHRPLALRTHHHYRSQGQGNPPHGGEDHHSRPPRRPPRPPPGATLRLRPARREEGLR